VIIEFSFEKDKYKISFITNKKTLYFDEYFGERYTASAPKKETTTLSSTRKNNIDDKVVQKINYIVRKSKLGLNEIREILVKHIKKNELIYNK